MPTDRRGEEESRSNSSFLPVASFCDETRHWPGALRTSPTDNDFSSVLDRLAPLTTQTDGLMTHQLAASVCLSVCRRHRTAVHPESSRRRILPNYCRLSSPVQTRSYSAPFPYITATLSHRSAFGPVFEAPQSALRDKFIPRTTAAAAALKNEYSRSSAAPAVQSSRVSTLAAAAG